MMIDCKICGRQYDSWTAKAAPGFCSEWCERSPFLPFPEDPGGGHQNGGHTMRIATLLALLALLLTGVARGQDTPQGSHTVEDGQATLLATLKGACSGLITDQNGGPVIRNQSLKCDSVIIMQIKDHTVVSFSDGDASKPILMFAGTPANPSNPQGFGIDGVEWGDGKPMKKAGWLPGDTGRVCQFHFTNQRTDWTKRLSEIECELVDPHVNGAIRVYVTFRTDFLYTIQGQQFTVEFTANGMPDVSNPVIRWNSKFRAKGEQIEFEGTCGVPAYQTYKPDYKGNAELDGHLRAVEPGSLIDQLFREVCK